MAMLMSVGPTGFGDIQGSPWVYGHGLGWTMVALRVCVPPKGENATKEKIKNELLSWFGTSPNQF